MPKLPHKELTGKTVVITRATAQSESLRLQLEDAGARVIECPTIQIIPPKSWKPVDAAIRRLDAYQWLLFTSANAVNQFCKRLAGVACNVPIAVVGSATAAKVIEWGLKPALIPVDFRAEGLLDAFPQLMVGIHVLFPRAEVARELLPDEIRRRGATVDVVVVYRTVQSDSGDLKKIITSEKVDCIVFTSPSTIPEHLAPELADVPIAVIGPVTREAARLLGLHPAIEPQESTTAALVAAIRNYFE